MKCPRFRRERPNFVRNVPVMLGSATGAFSVLGWLRWHGLGFDAAITLVTGYLAIALLVIALLIGPVRRLLHDRSPVHIRLRRRIGVAAALVSGIHTAIGLRVHLHGDVIRYFSEGGHLVFDQFRIANWTGLIALLALLPALLTSVDRALASLGAQRWKRVQRSILLAAPLAFLHAIIYTHIRSAWFLLFLLAVIASSTALIRLLARKQEPTKSR
jgi:DMSO/TMAO reductase YedYZ heme-binding membrane subunit